jgi:hypothetical protein
MRRNWRVTAPSCAGAADSLGGGNGEVLVVRRLATIVGALLAAVGFALALVSLALPWAHYRVSADVPADTEGTGNVERTGGIAVFQLDRGIWYVVILLAVLGLLAGATVGAGRTARLCGIAAALLAVVGMVITTIVMNDLAAAAFSQVSSALGTIDLHTSAGAGTVYALTALPLLGVGAAVLSVRTPAG